jgi:hypothetical protein
LVVVVRANLGYARTDALLRPMDQDARVWALADLDAIEQEITVFGLRAGRTLAPQPGPGYGSPGARPGGGRGRLIIRVARFAASTRHRTGHGVSPWWTSTLW